MASCVSTLKSTSCFPAGRHRLLRAALLSALLPLAGCATMMERLTSIPLIQPVTCTETDKATRMQLELVRQQMNNSKHHAALAHLDTIRDSAEAQLLRARSLATIGDTVAAENSYRSLLNTCLRAYGHQGLGTIAAGRRNLDEALDHLRQARELAPVDADIRNDYGFALLAAGNVQSALREFRTAVELAEGSEVAVRNLVLALFIAREPDEARALARHHALPQSEVDALAQRAGRFQPLNVTGKNIHETS